MIDERFFTRTDLAAIDDLLTQKQIAPLIESYKMCNDITTITHVATLNKAEQGMLCFFDNPNYKQDFTNCQGSFCIIHPKYQKDAPEGLNLIISPQPYVAYALIAAALYEEKSKRPALLTDYRQDIYGGLIHKNARLEEGVITAPHVVIHEGVEIGRGTQLKAGVTVQAGVAIGRDCVLESGVHLQHALLGDRVHLAAGVCIGQAGFGYAMGKTHIPVPQLGRVLLQDDVHVGANTTIDRGAILDTLIGEGTKLDNLIQVGHNVVMGRHCVFAGQCAIAGSTVFGDYVVSGGQTAYAGHLTIGAMAKIAGGAGVMHDIPAGQVWAGNFAKPKIQYFRELKTLEKLTKKA
jgi:UDP-3-O-[3-hydroxymyristoyl] glucosamine N-acyltransferase